MPATLGCVIATPTELPLQMGGPSPALPWEGTEKVPFFMTKTENAYDL